MFFEDQILKKSVAASMLEINTKISGAPVRARVSVIDRRSQQLLWHSLTENNGQIEIVLPASYGSEYNLTVLAHDDTSTYNAVVADNVQSELLQ